MSAIITSEPTTSRWLTPQNMEAGLKLAEMMAKAKLVPEHLRNSAADCLLVISQAARWGMDPFAVAQATAVVKGKLCYEGKLVAAVLVATGAIDGRLSYEFTGQGQEMAITITGKPRGQNTCTLTGSVKKWRTENNQWDKDPQSMLVYRGTRQWARLYTPEAVLGVKTPDDVEAEEPREVEATVHDEPRPARRRSAAAITEAPPAAVESGPIAGPATTATPEAPAAGAEKPADPPAAPDTSVKRCQDVTAALIQRGPGGKALVAGIMQAWKLRDVAQLGELTDEDRQAYIDHIAEADAKLEPAAGAKGGAQ